MPPKRSGGSIPAGGKRRRTNDSIPEEVPSLEPETLVEDDDDGRDIENQPPNGAAATAWGDNSEDLHNLSQVRDFPLPNSDAGIIQQVSLKNFMCHTRLDFNFGSHVNFVIGRNGSGKSAILTALTVGLGGKANSTNRGSSVKGFIKSGKNSADIKVKLRNKGEDAFEQHKYGESIIIERRFTKEGSTSYKIKSNDGTIISTKKEVLSKILDHFNIQVNNPVAILNQDCSKNFLFSKNPSDKYKFFLKATQMEQLAHDYLHAHGAKESALVILKDKQSTLPKLRDKVKEMEDKYKASQAVTGLHDKVKKLKDEQAWAYIIKQETAVEQSANQVQAEEARMPKYIQAVEKSENDLKDLKAQQKRMMEQIKESVKEAKQLEPLYQQAKDKLNHTKLSFRNAQVEVRKLTDAQRSLVRDLKDITNRIEEIKQSNLRDYEAERRLKEERIAELHERFDSYQATKRTTEHEMSQFQASVNQCREDLNTLRREQGHISHAQKNARDNLQQAEKSKKDKMNRFGTWMPQVLQRIEAHHRRGMFHAKPVGPLGAFIELNEHKWAVGIERCLGSLLNSFAVTDHHDGQQLEKIFAEVCPQGRRPATIVSPFRNSVHDVSRHCSQSKNFPTVFNMLKINNPVVMNCLIDQRNIENVILIEDNREARQVMQRQPPQNAREAFTLTADQIYASPAYRVYSGKTDQQASILVSSADINIKYHQDKLAQLDGELQQLQHRQSEINDNIKTNDQQAKACMARLNKLRNHMSAVEFELTELKEKEDPAPVDITTLENEARELEEKIKGVEDKMSHAQAHLEEQRANLTAQDEEQKRLGNQLTEIADSTEPYKEKRAEIDDKIDNLVGHVAHYTQKKKDHDKKVASLQKNHEELTTKLEEDIGKANQICPRVNSRRSPEHIFNEIKTIQKQIEKQERTRGNHEEIALKYHELKESYMKILKDVNRLDKFLKELGSVMERRGEEYNKFLKMMVSRVKTFFVTTLHRRSYTGRLNFDTVKGTLAMEVQPEVKDSKASKDMKSLSGGERSYATVCLIVSLWEAMESPFRCLDEFDVFMDMMNRKVAAQILLEVADQHNSRQYIFLTPLDLCKLSERPDIHVFRMPDPDRGQGTLPFSQADGDQEEEDQHQ